MRGRRVLSLISTLVAVAGVFFGAVLLPAPGVAHAASASAGTQFTAPAQAAQLQEDDWTAINRFVFLIAFDSYLPEITNVQLAARFHQLQSYQDLVDVTRNWRTYTFPTLQLLAAALASGDVDAQLAALQVALDGKARVPGLPPEDPAAILAALQNQLDDIVRMSNAIDRELASFDSTLQLALRQYAARQFPANPWVAIGPPLDEVEQALELVRGKWHALRSDLTSMRDEVARMAGEDALDLDLDLGVATRTWDDITTQAQSLIADGQRQRQVLTGADYYEHCPFEEGSWYRLRNRFLASKDHVLTLNGARLKMAPVSAGGDSRQEWQFQRVGQGWWRVISRSLGDTQAMDVVNDGKAFPLTMVTDKGTSGQFWRCLPTQHNGWFRLVNLFNGEMLSLDTYSDTYGAHMAASENRSGQYWAMEEVGSTD
ncbi:MAG: RICIN domain-containing protein [Anaerolineales bacterium]|nr:RICIN domain-containing protein [Anaerolineales bacterium]